MIEEGTYWTVHRCTNVPSRRKVYPVNGTPTFSCSCGDTVFASEEQIEDWKEAGNA